MYKGKKYNIFICYRGREDGQGGVAGAFLYSELKRITGFEPFYANAILQEGVDNFKNASRQALEDVKVFILLLTSGFFDDCFDDNDMVKDEIQTALNNTRIQFIPIVLPKFNAKQEFTKEVRDLFKGAFEKRIENISQIAWNDPGKFDIKDKLKSAIDEGFEAYDEAKDSKNTPVARQSYSNDDQESPRIYNAHSYAHSEWSYRGSKSEFGTKVKETLSPVVDFAKEWGLRVVFPVVLALIALITLLVCFCGVRGIYVNVDDPNEFYSFDATSYEYHGTLLGEDYVEKGTWKVDDGQLKLTHKGADGKKVTEAYYFDTLDSKKWISISAEFGVNKEFERVSLLAYSTPQKIKITFDGNGGSQGAYIPVESGMEPFAGGTQKVDIGSKIRKPAEPVRDGYLFMGWYTTPDGWKTGIGEQVFFEERVWEKTTYYANWKNASTFTLTGGGLDEPIQFTEGDDISAAYMRAMGWDSLPAGVTGLIFRIPNGNAIVATRAPAANVSVTVVGNYLIGNGVLKYVNPELERFVIPDGVTSIGDYAFRDCKSLTSVGIPDSVTSIGRSAFRGCTSLATVYITDIGKWAATEFGDSYANPLYYARNLYLNGKLVTDLVIPGSVTSIGNYAFYCCKSLTSVTIPSSVTSIGDSAFEDCDSLEAVCITDIGKWAATEFGGSYANPLYYAGNLYLNGELVTDLVIPGSVTSIGNYAFKGCTSLTSVTIPDGVTSIGDAAFWFCDLLTSITIGKGVTSIGLSAFAYCYSLTSVTIGNSVTSIGLSAFAYCYSLTSVTIPSSVMSIENYAFKGCTSLTSVTFEGTKAKWKAVNKSIRWHDGCPFTEVKCSDGVVSV